MLRNTFVVVVILAGINVLHGQNLISPATCTFFKTADCTIFKPRMICASDGRSFPNDCDFSKAHCKDASLHVIHDGKACLATLTHAPTSNLETTTPSPTLGSTVPVVDMNCNNTHNLNCNGFAPRLTCASNGKTYRTDCDFAKDHCTDTSLTVITFDQECQTTSVITTSIAKTSLKTTTPKETTVEVTTKETTVEVTTQRSVVTTKVATAKPTMPIPTTSPPKSPFDVLCRLLFSADCTDDLKVVCTTHGNYRNPCAYQKTKCLNPNIHHIHEGFCNPGEGFHTNPSPYEIACQAILKITCPRDGPPMCDNHGQQYTNFCELEKNKCLIHGIKIAACPS